MLANDLIQIHGNANSEIVKNVVNRVDKRGLANLKEDDYPKFLKEFNAQVMEQEVS